MSLALVIENEDDFVPEGKLKRPSGERDAQTIYMKEASSYQLLTREEEVELGRKIKKGCQDSRSKMIEHNLMLVVHIARKSWQQLPLLDLIGYGNIGLIIAAEKYDPEKGFKFSTYATWWIKQSIDRGCDDARRVVRVPVHKMKTVRRMMSAKRHLAKELQREPTHNEIADFIDVTRQEIDQLFDYAHQGVSLDQSVGDDENPLHHLFPDEDTIDPSLVVHDDWLQANIGSLINMLGGQNHVDVLYKRFGLGDEDPMTLDAVGKDLDITKERVRQIQLEAVKRLRWLLEVKGYEFADL